MYTSCSEEKIHLMNLVAAEARSCQKCPLWETRKNVVVGAGSLDTDIVLVGEAPGRREDETGLPFVGSAGKRLDGVLEKAGFSREDLFIANILKCRPPGNRRPKKAEVEICEGYLMRQLEIIEPHIVGAMGNSAWGYFCSRFGVGERPISEVHGRVYDVDASWGSIKLIPLFHPAAAIYRRHLLSVLEEDMKKLGRV